MSFWANHRSRLVLTPTFRRLVVWNAVAMTGLYVLFTLFTFAVIDYFLVDNLDQRLAHEAEHIQNAFRLSEGSVVLVNPAEFRETDLVTVSESSFFLVVSDTNGRLLIESDNIRQFGPIDPRPALAADDRMFFNMTAHGRDLRVTVEPVFDDDGRKAGTLLLASFREALNTVERAFLLFTLVTFPVVVVVIVLISAAVGRRHLAPLHEVVRMARHITATNLRERLSYESHPGDELDRLRETLNTLFDRLEVQIGQIRQFTDNAAHQLMTPLTTMKSEIEFALGQRRTPEEVHESLQVVRRQTEKIIHINRTLLLLATEGGDRSGFESSCDVSGVVSSVLASTRAGRVMPGNIETGVTVSGNSEYLRVAVENLIENALKYSPEATPVVVSLTGDTTACRIMVADEGPGIDRHERELVFERFYRGRQPNEGTVEGYGLGLSLVRFIVGSMGGTVRAEENVPRGTRMIVTLPLARHTNTAERRTSVAE